MLGGVTTQFSSVNETYSAVGDGSVDGCYITESYDATSHFESTMDDVAAIYARITGEDLFADDDEKK